MRKHKVFENGTKCDCTQINWKKVLNMGVFNKNKVSKIVWAFSYTNARGKEVKLGYDPKDIYSIYRLNVDNAEPTHENNEEVWNLLNALA